MKIRRIIFLALGLAAMLLAPGKAKAQFMPVVYDNTYGRNSQFLMAASDFQNGDAVTAVMNNGRVVLSWIDRFGDSRYSKQFEAEDLAVIKNIIPLSEESVLVVGYRDVNDKSRDRKSGRALILNKKGDIERSLYIGQEGTVVHFGAMLENRNLILSGSTPNAMGTSSGFVCKVSPRGNVVYNYVPAVGEVCAWFNVLGSKSTEYVNAAFSTTGGSGSSVVRIDENGSPYFITRLPDPSFKIEKMVSNVDGEIYLVGQGEQVGGCVIKIRPEGDVVFQKQVVPATADSKLDKLILYPTGELLVGGNDTQNAFYALLRSDGTELSFNVDRGIVSGIASNPLNGDCIVTVYNPMISQGKVVKMSRQGRKYYDKMTAANYTELRINVNGDVLMAAPRTGRLTMISSYGELLFDRFVVENNPQPFAAAYLAANGEALFASADNRLAKLAHGIYVSDITVNKPINGYTTAIFTITLSGYSYSKEGSPLPATVNYKTKALSAKEGLNFEPVTGTLSFVPATDGSDRYMNKFIVEVPVTANDLLEGDRDFTLELTDVQQSYLIRSTSKATIIDQPAVVRMISTSPGVEGEKNVNYTLGIFKTNGTPLTNAGQSDIVIDGVFGNGTSDGLDIDMGLMPRVTIPAGKHYGEYNAVALEDTRYEAVKTVIVNFNKISAMSDMDVTFGNTHLLSCVGQLYDQPAYVVIESLGDHTKLNNVISGLFKVTLVRAKDDAVLVNYSGSDIVVTPAINDSSTAEQGRNFVLTNSHDLRIWGDDKSSAVNLNGLVLYSNDHEPKTVSVSITDVRVSENAGPISIHPTRNTATFTIANN